MIRKIAITFLLSVVLAMSLTSCALLNKESRHIQSSMVGLNRMISLYSANGDIIGRWHTRSYVEVDGPICAFIDSTNKEVKISGTFIIQQE